MRFSWGTVYAALAIGLAVLWGTRAPALEGIAETLTGAAPRGGDVAQAPLLAESAPLPSSALTAPEGGDAAGALWSEGVLPFREIGDELPPDFPLAAMLVGDPATGVVYASKNPDRRWPIASITKLFAAAYATDTLSPTSTVPVREEDVARVADSAEGKLKAGEAYETRDLVRVMLMISSNESAEALAAFTGREAFIRGMNALAADWGLGQTYLADPTGLSVASQSTPRDLLLLAGRFLRDYPALLRVSRTPRATVIEQVSKKGVALQNINEFAGDAGFLGGKTGFIEESEGNLLSIFSHGGRPVAVVVLGSADRFGDTEKLIAWFRKNYN